MAWLISEYNCKYFLTHHFLHMFWVLKNRLFETVLLSTHSICFGWEIGKLFLGTHSKLKAWFENLPWQYSQSISWDVAVQPWDLWSVRESPAIHHQTGSRILGRHYALSPGTRWGPSVLAREVCYTLSSCQEDGYQDKGRSPEIQVVDWLLNWRQISYMQLHRG